MYYLKRETDTNVIIGPMRSTSNNALQTGLTFVDGELKISRNGGTFSDIGTESIVHLSGGYYQVPLTFADTGQAGRLLLSIEKTGSYSYNNHEFFILDAHEYTERVEGIEFNDQGRIWFVGASQSEALPTGTRSRPFDNLMDALNEVSPGDTIRIEDGEYDVSITDMPNGIKIFGASREGVIINNDETMTITRDLVIENLTWNCTAEVATYPNPTFGIVCGSGRNVVFRNMNISSDFTTLNLGEIYNLLIDNCDVRGQRTSCKLQFCKGEIKDSSFYSIADSVYWENIPLIIETTQHLIDTPSEYIQTNLITGAHMVVNRCNCRAVSDQTGSNDTIACAVAGQVTFNDCEFIAWKRFSGNTGRCYGILENAGSSDSYGSRITINDALIHVYNTDNSLTSKSIKVNEFNSNSVVFTKNILYIGQPFNWENEGYIVDFVETDIANIFYTEVGTGTPPASTSIVDMIRYLYKAWRNKSTTDKNTGEYIIYQDNGTTPAHKAVCTDDGTTFTRGELTSG